MVIYRTAPLTVVLLLLSIALAGLTLSAYADDQNSLKKAFVIERIAL